MHTEEGACELRRAPLDDRGRVRIVSGVRLSGATFGSGQRSGTEVRECLTQCEVALSQLGAASSALIESSRFNPQPFLPFIDAIARDAHDSRAAIRLVLASR